MLGLYLIASHMAGDFLFQSEYMAAHKLHDRYVRFMHVSVYCACFLPVALIYGGWKAPWFLIMLGITHYLIDSKRWRTSNPWRPMPILHDQSLHAVQLAALGGLFFAH